MTDKLFWKSLKLEIDAIYLVGCCMKNSFASLETFYHVAYKKLLTRFPEIKPHVYHVMASSLFCLSTWKLFHKYKQTWKKRDVIDNPEVFFSCSFKISVKTQSIWIWERTSMSCCCKPAWQSWNRCQPTSKLTWAKMKICSCVSFWDFCRHMWRRRKPFLKLVG